MFDAFYTAMLHLGTMAAKKRPLLTPFLTPVALRRAHNWVPSILALGLFLSVSDFTQPENGLSTLPFPFPYTALLAAKCRWPKSLAYIRGRTPARSYILYLLRILCLTLYTCDLYCQRWERALYHTILLCFPFLYCLLQLPAAVLPANYRL